MKPGSSVKWNPRGSEWHRWDPHLHAPGTLLNDQFKGDWTTYIARIAKSVPQIRVLGVTDYFCIEAYKAVLRRYESGELPGVALLFPNVEFRLDLKTHTNTPINLHLLFSPDDPHHIEQIERILANLQYEYRDRQYRCTVDDLVQLGRSFKPAQHDRRGALVEGSKQFKVTLRDLRTLFRTEAWLRENCLVAVSGRTSDGTSGLQRDESFASTREEIERFADIIFAAAPNDRDYWLGKKPGFGVEYMNTTYRGLKPCLHGSDAHRSDTVGTPDHSRYCWIKGDLVFESLRQATLEPERRVWIGSHAPNYKVGPLTVSELSTVDAPWQRTDRIPLNDGLVTVIGPRGSGKTALVDMIAAVASAGREPDTSSFIARAYQPTDLLGNGRVLLTWSDGTVDEAFLSRHADRRPSSHSPAARYLSQHFVDRLCSSSGLGTELRNEIQRVVFDATDPTDRLETNSFRELADVHMNPVRLRREELQRVIAQTSQKIIDAQELHAKLAQLKAEEIQIQEQIERDRKQQAGLVPKGHEERAERLAQLEQLYADREAEIQHLRFRGRKLSDLLAEVRNIRNTSEPARWRDMLDRYRAAELPTASWREFAMEFRGEVEDVCQQAISETEVAIRRKSQEDGKRALAGSKTREGDWPLSVIRARRDELKKEVGIDVAKTKRYAQIGEAVRLNAVKLRRIGESILLAKGAKAQRQKLIEARRQTYEAVFQTLVEEENVLKKLYLPLDSRLSTGDAALSKLKFIVRRSVDLESWVQQGEALLDRVRLFFVDGPRGFCQRHGKSYLTRRRRGGEGGGGGLLTGRAIPSAYRWAWCRWYSRVVEVPVRFEVAAGFVAPGASEPPRLQPSWPPGGSGPAHG